MDVHICGGTVLVGGSGDQQHQYCDRCRAFTYDMQATTLPTGTDRELNQVAWDGGEKSSPEAAQHGDLSGVRP